MTIEDKLELINTAVRKNFWLLCIVGYGMGLVAKYVMGDLTLGSYLTGYCVGSYLTFRVFER